VARYLLVVLAPAAMLAAVAAVGPVRIPRQRGAQELGGLRRLARARGMQVLRLLTILVLLAATAYPGHRAVRSATAKNGPDYRGVAQIVERHQLPGDVVVYEVRSRALRAGMEYYLRRYPSAPRDVLLRRPAAEAAQLRADEYPDAAARVGGSDRVWLVVGGNRADPTTGYPALRRLLRAGYERIGIWHLSRATVALFRRRERR
jgi:mannosyltransferase